MPALICDWFILLGWAFASRRSVVPGAPDYTGQLVWVIGIPAIIGFWHNADSFLFWCCLWPAAAWYYYRVIAPPEQEAEDKR